MKFLVDENLPPAFAVWLCQQGHDAIHVDRANLRGAADASIADHATHSGRVVITRDSDFDQTARRPSELRVLRLTIGNCTNSALLAWMQARLEVAVARLQTETFVLID